MKKHILLAFGFIFAALASKAAVGDRFQDDGIWYEVLDEDAKTCQTAPAPNSENLEVVVIPVNPYYSEVKVLDSVTGEDRTYNIGAPNANKNGNLTIPSIAVKDKVAPYTVIKIGDFSFAGGSTVGKLVLPETMTEIGKGAFYKWTNDFTIDFGHNPIDIKDYAFAGCNGLKKTFIVPANIMSIGKGAFLSCQNLLGLEFEDGPNPIILSEGLMEGSTSLSSIKFSNRNESISDSAFRNCQSLEKVEFAEGMKYIGNSAFENCSHLGPIMTLPDSLLEIGEAAFKNCTDMQYINFGKNLTTARKEAFYNVCLNHKNLYFPASLVNIEEYAFNFEQNGTNFTDLYYPNMNPIATDRMAFGKIENNEFNKWDPDYWIYATVCLHVPFGTTAKYRELEDWRFFKCIIDDILPEESENDRTHSNPDDALAYIIDYLYIVPGDDIDLNSLLRQNKLIGEDEEDSFKWEPISDIPGNEGYNKEKSDILTLGSDGIGKAKENAYGNVIALGNRKSSKYNSNNSTEVPVYAPLGAVIIFVCPTITVVYDKDNAIETKTPSQPAQAKAKAPRRAGEEGSNDNIPSADTLQSENSTYSHPVVFNSLPKVQVNPAPSITISNIERAAMDVDNNYIPGEELQDVDGKLMDTGEEKGYTGSIVPQEPITENRMLVVTLDLDEGIMTGAEEIEIDDKISVAVSGRNLSVIGVDEDAELLVADLNGRIVYSGTEKALSLEPGVYIIRVEDVAFKAIVR